MKNGQRVLAIVPARGGSKGVPRKNIRDLAGEPLIGYTLRTASKVDAIDLLVVSTDDPEIASVSEGYGVKVIRRPTELATDTASTEVALIHSLNKLAAEGLHFDIVLVLEPTSPFRSNETIVRAIDLCSGGSAHSVLAVRESRENIGFVSNGFFRPVVLGAPRRRQDRQPFYVESSTIYACRTAYLHQTGTLVAEDWTALVVPASEAIDINTEDDFQLVEFLMHTHKRGKEHV